jgi:hypothetical protein
VLDPASASWCDSASALTSRSDVAGDAADASKGVARGVSNAASNVVEKAKDLID